MYFIQSAHFHFLTFNTKRFVYILHSNRSVYKLSDFGSAKKLELDEEAFMSMYGTEEYLVSSLAVITLAEIYVTMNDVNLFFFQW